MLRRYSHVFFGITVLADVFFTACGWILTYAVRFSWGPSLSPYLFLSNYSTPPFSDFGVLFPIVIVCNLIAFESVGLYRPARTRTLRKEVLRVWRGAFLAWISMIAVFYFIRQYRYSIKFILLFFFINAFMLSMSRFSVLKILRYLRRSGIGMRYTVIVGTGILARGAFERLEHNPWVGQKVKYFIDPEKNTGPKEISGVPVKYSCGHFLECLKEHPVEDVFVALQMNQEKLRDSILKDLARLPVAVAVVPDLNGAIRINSGIEELEDMSVVLLRDSPVYGWSAMAKRTIDIVGTLSGLLLFGWLMVVIAIFIKLTSRGPVFFRQRRMGVGGKPFNMLKFRSMIIDAEKDSGPVMAVMDDPRCTFVGRFLRRTSMDELPQLINVLMGNMSLVGPRPERPHFVEQFTDQLPAYMLRHSVKAGITGWAQVKGLRGNTSIKKRLQYDLYYIDHWSLLFDLFILLITPFSSFLNRKVY